MITWFISMGASKGMLYYKGKEVILQLLIIHVIHIN